MSVSSASVTAPSLPSDVELCEHFLPLLCALGRRRLGDDGTAEELAQDVMVVVLRARRDGTLPADHVGPYVLTVARNLIREGYRRAKRERSLPVKLAPLTDVTPPPADEDGEHLRRCLAKLTARAREVLERAVVLDETGPEIAEAMKLTEGNVRVIRHRALAEVRACLEAGA